MIEQIEKKILKKLSLFIKKIHTFMQVLTICDPDFAVRGNEHKFVQLNSFLQVRKVDRDLDL